jgi:hypothetical protein
MNDAQLSSDRPQPSARKIAANQANAQHSTGPRSPGGKAKSSQNSIKYGFYSQAVLMNGEDPQAYDDLREHLWSNLNPRNALEEICARNIIDAHWRLQRLAFVETTVITRRSVSFTGHHCGPGFGFINDDQSHATLSKLSNCEATLSRRLERAVEQYRKLRKEGLNLLPPRANADIGGTGQLSEAEDPQAAAPHPVGPQPTTNETDANQPPTPSVQPDISAVLVHILGDADPAPEEEAPQQAAGHPVGAQPAPQETKTNQPPKTSDPPKTPEVPTASPSKIREPDDAITRDIKGPKTRETQKGFER